MILDTLENHHLYRGLGTRFIRAFEALTTGIGEREDGTYELGGPDVKAIVQRYQTRPIEKCTWEAHRKFIDIQFMQSGAEQMGWKPIDQLRVRDPYSQEKDAEFYESDGSNDGQLITVSAGMFVIFFPTDGHRPCVAMNRPEPIAKVVVKIAV